MARSNLTPRAWLVWRALWSLAFPIMSRSGAVGGARTFFVDEDYAFYKEPLGPHCREPGVAVWAWVLMLNHVHLILNPSDSDDLRRALRERIGGALDAFMRFKTGPGISGGVGLAHWRWTKRIRRRRCVMSSSRQREPASWIGRAIGAGPARRRIWPPATRG
jgi:REP element-mobilizing transposase RayT